MLNELEVTVEGEDTEGKDDSVEGAALGFPAKALENGAWGQGLPAAVVRGAAAEEEEEEEEHEDEEAEEDGMVADDVGGGVGVLWG